MRLRELLIIGTLVAFALPASADQGLIEPALSKLAPWTKVLRDAQPDDAFAAIYEVADKNLIFLAAKHSTQTDSLTFALIHDAYAAFDIDTVIVEGPRTHAALMPSGSLNGHPARE